MRADSDETNYIGKAVRLITAVVCHDAQADAKVNKK